MILVSAIFMIATPQVNWRVDLRGKSAHTFKTFWTRGNRLIHAGKMAGDVVWLRYEVVKTGS